MQNKQQISTGLKDRGPISTPFNVCLSITLPTRNNEFKLLDSQQE